MRSVLMLNHMTSFIFYKHIKNKEQIRHFFFIITRSIAGVVLTASTIAFQAIGTGSNPVTRSNLKKKQVFLPAFKTQGI